MTFDEFLSIKTIKDLFKNVSIEVVKEYYNCLKLMTFVSYIPTQELTVIQLDIKLKDISLAELSELEKMYQLLYKYMLQANRKKAIENDFS